MESIGKGYIKGVYKNGSIHTPNFSIRVCPFNSFPECERLFVGKVYLDALDRPYISIDNEVQFLDMYRAEDSFISLLLKPKSDRDLELIELHNSTKVWVDFRNIQEKCDGYYQCTLEFRDSMWIFVAKGCDKTSK
jgi:hypothetical protein